MKKQIRIVTLLILLLAGLGKSAIAADHLLNIDTNNGESIKVYQLNSVEIPHHGSVRAGETYRVVASCADENYLFDCLKVAGGKNIIVEDKENGKCLFTVVGSGSVTVKALFKGKPQTINLTEPDKTKGDYVVTNNGVVIKNEDKVPYGSELLITPKPKEGYEVDKICGGEATILPVKEDRRIEVSFKDRMLTVDYDTTPLWVLLDGELVSPGNKVPYNSSLMLFPQAKSMAMINSDSCILDKNSLIYYTIKDDIKITCSPIDVLKPKVIFNTEKAFYTGKPQSYSTFKIVPALEGAITSYKKEGSKNFVTDMPTEAGFYQVKIDRPADQNYGAIKATGISSGNFIIEPAEVIVKKLPVVSKEMTVNGGQFTFGSKNVEGLLTASATGETGLAKVTFTPTSSNYKKAVFCIPIQGAEIETIPIQSSNLPNGTALKYANGNYGIDEQYKVAVGTEIEIIPVQLPAGKIIKGYINQLSETQSEPITSPFTVQTGKNYRISAVLSDKPESELQTIALNSEVINQSYTYSMVPILYETSKLATNSDINKNGWIISYKNKKTAEVVIAPIEAGEYEVTLTYPADDKFEKFIGKGALTITPKAAKAVDFSNLQASKVVMGQTLASSTISGGYANVPGKFEWKDATKRVYSGVNYPVVFVPADQKNYQTIDVKSIPVLLSSETQLVLSVSADFGTVNVNNKTTGKQIQTGGIVTTGDELVISAKSNVGYKLAILTVNDNTIQSGTSYIVGDKAPSIVAEFSKGVDPAKVFTVTIPEVVGAIVSNVGENLVSEGNSFSFSIDYDLLYGAPKVTAGGKALAYDGEDLYTIAKVTKDTTITITLPKYGHYTVRLPQDSTLGEISVEVLYPNTKTPNTGYTYGTELKLTAIPVEGVRFNAWWDGSTENPYIWTIKSDLLIKASFIGTPTETEEIELLNDVWCIGRKVYVQTDRECTISIVDMWGRVIHRDRVSGSSTFEISQAGVYVVSLNNDNKNFLHKKINVW